MRSRLDRLDRVASDLANATTAGYKSVRAADEQADRAQFEAVLSGAVDVMSGVPRLDARPGTVAPTGRDLDVAIEGDGFFAIQTASGVRYTRNGHFSVRADGALVTDDGSRVLGTEGALALGPGKVSIDRDGAIRTGDAAAGRLAIVDFADRGSLTREGASRLRADGQTPAPVAQPIVHGGALEQSNASVVERIAELVDVQRSFEALQKAVSLALNDTLGRAIDTLGRR
ncbi:MAG: flagellar hook basal-body protein [Acidobacteria bacterium]|nr:flagellar hook basal-body protein [Acidobacteriota bacterium]